MAKQRKRCERPGRADQVCRRRRMEFRSTRHAVSNEMAVQVRPIIAHLCICAASVAGFGAIAGGGTAG
ncbi:MAG: hypothetical protein ACPGXX_17385, partial [Planctomycetaceae bacterium]